jgi:transposase
MREGIDIEVSAADRERLAAVVADRNSPQKHVWRARIILATGEGCGTAEIMRRAGVSKPCVWRWQERFMREGVAGLLRDKTRKPGLPSLPSALVDHVIELTLAEPPGETTHWTGRAMAAASGISLRSVQRIWAAHGLQPHRVRRFKLSQGPAFAAKLRDVVGLYLDPPAHSLVLSVDEKSQIQALDRTQPGLPIRANGRLRAASAASQVGVPFHPDLVLLGQCGRRVLRHDEAGPGRDNDPRLHPQRHESLSRRAQPQTQTIRLDRRPQSHHRKGQPWAPSDRVRPLGVGPRGPIAILRMAGCGALPPPAARPKPSWSVSSLG